MSLRKFGVGVAALLLMVVAVAVAYAERGHSVYIQHSEDLARDGELARQRNVPMLVMFSMDNCPYCNIVEDEFLRPMLISGDYEDKVLIRMIKVDSYDTLTDFNGESIEADDIANRYSAFLTPTVVFVDSRGNELAERLVGLTTVDFYGGDLDDRIDLALSHIRTLRVSKNSVTRQ